MIVQVTVKELMSSRARLWTLVWDLGCHGAYPPYPLGCHVCGAARAAVCLPVLWL